MARFDVYPHPDSAVPLRPAGAFPLRMRDLNPIFEIAGRELVAHVAALAAFPAAELRTPVTNLRSNADAVASALDTLFGPY